MTVRWLNENKPVINLNKVEEEPEMNALGTFLGAAPQIVKVWMPTSVPDWDGLTSDQQQALVAAATQRRDAFNSMVQSMKNQVGACDATIPGSLAGQLREYLIAKGGDEAKLGDDEGTFGPKEMSEWIRIFGSPPSVSDAEAAVGKEWFDNIPITLSTFCKDIKLPTKVTKPVPQTPVEPPVSAVSPKKSSNLGWLLLAGSTLGALAFALMPKAKKLPPQRGARRGNSLWR